MMYFLALDRTHISFFWKKLAFFGLSKIHVWSETIGNNKRTYLKDPSFFSPKCPNIGLYHVSQKKHKLGFSLLITKISLPKLVPILIRRCWVRIWARIWKQKCFSKKKLCYLYWFSSFLAKYILKTVPTLYACRIYSCWRTLTRLGAN